MRSVSAPWAKRLSRCYLAVAHKCMISTVWQIHVSHVRMYAHRDMPPSSHQRNHFSSLLERVGEQPATEEYEALSFWAVRTYAEQYIRIDPIGRYSAAETRMCRFDLHKTPGKPSALSCGAAIISWSWKLPNSRSYWDETSLAWESWPS